MFADSHVHLHFPDFDADRLEVMRHAEEAGVSLFINVGTDVESTRASLALARGNPKIFSSAGIHPHDAAKATAEAMREIEKLARDSRVVAIGEVGLDFFRDHSPHETQKKVLREFVALARRLDKPLILHCRDAYNEMETLLLEAAKPPFRGVMHCFSSDAEAMKRFLDLGFYISFAGPLTYKKNDALREACRDCPADRLLLETDAPFLPPQSRRGKRNESSYLVETAGVAAYLRSVALEALGEQTTQNVRDLFRL